jgi:hypothetical protein
MMKYNSQNNDNIRNHFKQSNDTTVSNDEGIKFFFEKDGKKVKYMKQKISMILVTIMFVLTISPMFALEPGAQTQNSESLGSKIIRLFKIIEKPRTTLSLLGPEMIWFTAISAQETLQNAKATQTAHVTETPKPMETPESPKENLTTEASITPDILSIFGRRPLVTREIIENQDSHINQTDLNRLRCWIASFNRNLSDSENYNIAKWILEDCKKYNVDWKVAASLFAAESAYRPHAVSPVGARGLGQLMPETAMDLGVTNSFDIRQNIDGSIRYVARNLGRWQGFPDQLNRTLASYNAGFGAVTRFNGIPPYRETINYVSKINGYVRELNNPQIGCFRSHHLASNRTTSCPVEGHNHDNVARQR